ncbi:MAG: ABC transporter ATP-binding protein [Clostridia bacterium]|nr:ABC transporter ATP-binding protein [Clostridia bacterium]
MKKRSVYWVWEFLKGTKAAFLIGIASTLITALTGMLSPQIIRLSVDQIILGEPTDDVGINSFLESFGGAAYLKENLWIPALILLAVAAVAFLTNYLYRVSNTYGAETLTKNMREKLFDRVSHLPFSWHMKNHTGDIIQRSTSDVETVKNFVSEQLTGIFRIIIMVVMSLSFMFSMNWKMALIAASCMPLILIYSLVFHKKIKTAFTECDESEGKLSAMAQENLTGVRVVRAFGREGYEKDKFVKYDRFYTGLWTKLAKIMARFWASNDIITGLEILIVMVSGAVFTVNGELSVGEYIAFISYNEMLLWPIRMLGRMLSEMSKAGVSLNRIVYIMDSEPERDKEGAGECDMTGDIAFEHVNFAYENCPELLHDVSFRVKAGTTVGIMGGTGSGKSTLMLLLDKVYDLEDPDSKITVGGVDIRDVRTEYLRSNIGIVLQEPYLFSRTLAENIGIKREGTTLEEIREAAKAAALDETIESFTDGYDTFVGERGVTLSGGQKQRTAIARALTGNTPVLIFDDSLSAVDTETDAKIRRSLEKKFGTATVFLISHRITTLKKADLILVLDHGTIKESGTHEELVAQGGIYAEVYRAQTDGVDEL